jgi:hypothetical protein
LSSGSHGIGVILVLIAAGDLQDALAHQEGERVADWTAPPVRALGGEGGRDTQVVVGLGEPDEPPSEVSCPASKVTGSDERAAGRDDMRESDTGEPPGAGESMKHLDHNQEARLFQERVTKLRE